MVKGLTLGQKPLPQCACNALNPCVWKNAIRSRQNGPLLPLVNRLQLLLEETVLRKRRLKATDGQFYEPPRGPQNEFRVILLSPRHSIKKIDVTVDSVVGCLPQILTVKILNSFEVCRDFRNAVTMDLIRRPAQFHVQFSQIPWHLVCTECLSGREGDEPNGPLTRLG